MRLIGILLLASLALPGMAVAAPDSAFPSIASAPIKSKPSSTMPRASASLRDASDDALPPPIHGEIGFSIGTGGYRSAFGTAVVPLPGDGAAIFSFGTDRFEPGRDFYYRER